MATTALDLAQERPRTGGWRNLGAVLRRQRNIAVGGITLIFLVLVAIFAGLIAPHDPNLITPAERLLDPSSENPFGTDGQGRDVFSRVVHGARLSLGVGFAVAIATAVVGTVIGLAAGFYSRVDAVVMRVMDGVMAFPGVILAIGVMAVRGAQVSNIILALTIVNTPRLARVVRSVVLGVAESQFVEAAAATGLTGPRILFRHILPNCLSPLIVQASFVFAEAVLGEATLSFLGAGAPADVPSWGTMLNESKLFLSQAPWTMLAPGAALTLTVFALNLLGDGLRDTLDPRLRHR
ncbi:MAG: ABC transporter permease [Thermomicrobiales bacterium]